MAEGSQSPEVPIKVTPQSRHDREQKPIADARVTREAQFPKDAEKRFEAVFSSIGNSEAKCLTLLCLSESPISPPDLRVRFMHETSNVWTIHYSGPSKYCQDTLVPIGLVAETDVLYSGSDEYITGYRLTDAGKTFGHPIAAFLLKKSEKLPYSLLKLFGQTSKTGGGTRSVINRTRILELLVKNSATSTRRIDISEALRLDDGVVGRHLSHLFNLGLINYSSLGPEDIGLVRYTISGNSDVGGIERVNRQSSQLTGDVIDILKQLRVVDSHSIAEKIKQNYPDKTEGSLLKGVGEILSGLAAQGHCERELFSKKVRSDTKISQAGIDVVNSIVLPIKRALSGDEELLSSWRQIHWQDLAKDALAKYREESGHANAVSEVERLGRTLEIINNNPGIRPRELGLSLQYVPTNLLKTLLESGKIRKERQGSGVAYFPVSDPIDKTA